MDEVLANVQVDVPPLEQVTSGFDDIQQASDNTEMRRIILEPLLEFAGKPCSVGSLVFALSELYGHYELYLAGIGELALSTFRLISEDLAEAILMVLIPNESLCETVVREFLAGDLERTAPDDGDHGCSGK